MDVNSTFTEQAKAIQGEKSFAKIDMLLEAAGGLSLSQVCSVTGLEGSTIQNWVKRGWVAHPIGKRYEEVHIARILIINALKECIKLEHIALLMEYVNGKPGIGNEPIIKESTMYNYLCEALKRSSQVDDHSKSGVESVVESVIKDYKYPLKESRVKVRKALMLMMFACVCTDVKRRTEAMMGQILKELGGESAITPSFEPVTAQIFDTSANQQVQPVAETTEAATEVKQTPLSITPIRITIDEPEETVEDVIETRKTVSQALREWDISSVEKIIIDHDGEESNNAQGKNEEDAIKPVNRPWYIRKNTK